VEQGRDEGGVFWCACDGGYPTCRNSNSVVVVVVGHPFQHDGHHQVTPPVLAYCTVSKERFYTLHDKITGPARHTGGRLRLVSLALSPQLY
jgi:hypothetical protein